jgi:hypothetical protein
MTPSDGISVIFGDMEGSGHTMVQGPIAAELYQTYGVPPELVESMSAEHGYTFDWTGFRDAMEEHGQKGRRGPGELFKTGPIEQLKGSPEIHRVPGVFHHRVSGDHQRDCRGQSRGRGLSAVRLRASNDARPRSIAILRGVRWAGG